MTSEAKQDFALAFLGILLEGAPFILLGTIISGFIDIYLPSGAIDRFLPRKRYLAILVSGTLGAILPVCECAVVPVIRRLVSKGLPFSCAITYMLAAPILNPITALSTWKAFQGQLPDWMTFLRTALGYSVAVLIGVAIARIPIRLILKKDLADEADGNLVYTFQPQVPKNDNAEGSMQVVADDGRLIAAMRSAQKDFVDVAVYFTIGVTITALFNTGIAPAGARWLDGLAGNHLMAPAALMGLAFILSLCSTSDAFIAATLHKFSWAAKLAFLTFGPMFDVKLLFLYQAVLNRRFILILGVSLFVIIWLASLAVHHWFMPYIISFDHET